MILICFLLFTALTTVVLVNRTRADERKQLEYKVLMLEAAGDERDHYKKELGKYENMGGGPFRSPQPVEKPVERKPRNTKPRVGTHSGGRVTWNLDALSEIFPTMDRTMTFTVPASKVDDDFLRELKDMHVAVEDAVDLSKVRIRIQEKTAAAHEKMARVQREMKKNYREMKRRTMAADIEVRQAFRKLGDD